jgi:hypothetical protein
MSLFDDASLVLTPNGYKASKLYSIKPTSGAGDMVVSRGTTARRVNSSNVIESMAINVPRLDYPPLGGCPRILIEPERINRVFYSEEFNNAYWLKYSATVIANTTTAPDGTTTADLVHPSTTGVLTGQVYKIITTGITSGDVVTVSVFVKASGKNFAYISPVFNFSPGAWFNLTTCAITNPIANVTTSMTEFANGWWRISLTSTSTSSVSNNVTIGSTDATNSTTNTASGTNGILIWGAQIEVGSTATSYIPTTTAIATRNADVISKTGVSSLIGQTEGTIFIEANLTANTDQRRIITLGTELQRIMFWTSGTTLRANFNSVMVTIGTFPIGTAKMALGYTISGGSTTYSIKLNNDTLITGTAAAAPSSLSAINLGNSANGTLILNDRIESATLFLTRLTDPQLANLTAI